MRPVTKTFIIRAASFIIAIRSTTNKYPVVKSTFSEPHDNIKGAMVIAPKPDAPPYNSSATG
jgi:hypothetical protein